MLVRGQIVENQLCVIQQHGERGQDKETAGKSQHQHLLVSKKSHPRHVDDVRPDESQFPKGQAQQEEVEVAIVVQAHRGLNKGTVVIKEEDALSPYPAVLAPVRSGDVTGMAERGSFFLGGSGEEGARFKGGFIQDPEVARQPLQLVLWIQVEGSRICLVGEEKGDVNDKDVRELVRVLP